MGLHCRLFGHGTWHRGRNAKGEPSRLCDQCLRPIGALLAGEMITTPLPQVVAGEPTSHAKPVVPLRANVAQWKTR